jgi:CubicO group peptidase (beta-lactamase class C family)
MQHDQYINGCNVRLATALVRPTALAMCLIVAAVCATAALAVGPRRITPAAAGMNERLEDQVGALVGPAIERGDLPGCVVLIGRRAGIAFEKAYGQRSVEPTAVPMTTDTVFDMASLTKPIATATSVMLLVERGQLRLQDKVAKFFPEFAAHGKQDVTLEQLLVHSAGLIPDNPLDDYLDGWASAKPKICELKPIAEPGAAFKYSDVGFILLGKIIELPAKKSSPSSGCATPATCRRPSGVPAPPPPSSATASGWWAKSTIRAPRGWAASPVTPVCSARRATWQSTPR